jgi:hypothetical protein
MNNKSLFRGYHRNCVECNNLYSYSWCERCQMSRLIEYFKIWSCKNETGSKLIQEMQLVKNQPTDVAFKRISYNNLDNIKEIYKNDFAAVYSAIWKDYSNVAVSLKYLCNSQHIENNFLI